MRVTAHVETKTLRTTDQYLEVERARLRYRDEGAGPAVVLVHGWTLDLEMWEPQVAQLRDYFRLIRFDRRGFGLSTGTPAASQDVADLNSLRHHLALDRIALVGMSQGARSALGFAAVAPERVSALILDGPPPLGSASTDDDVPVAQFRALMQSEGIESFRREWQRHPLMQLRTQDRGTHRLLRAMLDRYPGRDLLENAAMAPREAEQADPAHVRTPALILTGEFDMASRSASADMLSRQLPCAERAYIAAAGHLPNLDNPMAYNELCRSFLARHL